MRYPNEAEHKMLSSIVRMSLAQCLAQCVTRGVTGGDASFHAEFHQFRVNGFSYPVSSESLAFHYSIHDEEGELVESDDSIARLNPVTPE